jgi:hypothetical protein
MAVPIAMTANVASERYNASLFVKSHMARMLTITLQAIQIEIVINEKIFIFLGLRNPLRRFSRVELPPLT